MVLKHVSNEFELKGLQNMILKHARNSVKHARNMFAMCKARTHKTNGYY